MTVNNYQTGTELGTAEIDEEKYESYAFADNTATGAVKAGEWLSNEELESLGIDVETTVFFN